MTSELLEQQGDAPLRIFLIRHGETEWNRLRRFQGRSDVPLNAVGRAQARALARVLKDEPFIAFYTSPLSRAVQTARIIHEHHASAPIVEERRLMEMDIGEFEGMEGARFVAEHAEFLKAWQEDPASVRMPGGETLGEVQSRALEALRDIASRHSPGCRLLVSAHNFLNLTILCHAMGIPLSDFRRIRQGTAALNVLCWRADTVTVERLDDRSHLESLREADHRSRPGS